MLRQNIQGKFKVIIMNLKKYTFSIGYDNKSKFHLNEKPVIGFPSESEVKSIGMFGAEFRLFGDKGALMPRYVAISTDPEKAFSSVREIFSSHSQDLYVHYWVSLCFNKGIHIEGTLFQPLGSEKHDNGPIEIRGLKFDGGRVAPFSILDTMIGKPILIDEETGRRVYVDNPTDQEIEEFQYNFHFVDFVGSKRTRAKILSLSQRLVDIMRGKLDSYSPIKLVKFIEGIVNA